MSPETNFYVSPEPDPRLRVFDWNTPWFQVLIFWRRNDWRRAYAKPLLEITVRRPHTWRRWWFHFMEREQ